MRVVWSDDATRALVALETGLAVRSSPDQAARILEELVRRVDRREDHPQLGRVVPEYGQWQLRELVEEYPSVDLTDQASGAVSTRRYRAP
jgi:toxin ParE1/3/4